MIRPEGYSVHLSGFDGPLDLLLRVVELRELDVTTVSLAKVADDYLAYVRAMEHIDPNALAEFIVVAAKLLLIKSAALLPASGRDRAIEDIDDPTDLTERLMEYQAFRGLARVLQEREESGLRSYPRLVPLSPPTRVQTDRGVPEQLLSAFRRLLIEVVERPKEVDIVEREAFSIGDKIELFRERCARGGRVRLRELLRGVRRSEAVATFLALLELIRLGELDAVQTERYGDVEIVGRAQGT